MKSCRRFLTDYGKARELQPDGSYVRLKPRGRGAPLPGAVAFPRTFAAPGEKTGRETQTATKMRLSPIATMPNERA